MTRETHLTEDERHALVDGSLAPEKLAATDAHLRVCAGCAADVDRIRRLMKRIDDSKSRAAAAPTAIDDLWPSIRSRIEEQKVVALGINSARETASPSRRSVRPQRWVIGSVVAAGIIALWFSRGLVAPDETPTAVNLADSGISLVALMDSTAAYQEEAQALLNHLELQRATLRPELSRAIERDLRTIDVAIAELQGAIKTDPRNPELRRLLASSYRQKVDLLKRVSNAG